LRHNAVLLDPFPVVLDAVADVLTHSDIDIAGKTTSPNRALELVSEQRPELMVTEIRFPDERVNGLELIREARRRRHELKAVIFTAHDNCQTVAAAFDAGAAAYVLKNAHPDDLASAIRQSFEHSMYLPASGPVAGAGARPADESELLTRRETEILRLVSEGHSNAKLAQMLWVTEQTVKFHLSNIYRKLSVANRTEASRWAQIHGLLTPSQTAAGEEARPEPMRLQAVSLRR
jgi:DNA-binding NarL/FixJ family response regulator